MTSEHPNKKWTKAVVEALAEEILEFYREDESRVYIKDFFVHKGINFRRAVDFKTVKKWRENYELVKDIQESRLFKMLTDKTKPQAGVIFALKNICQWRDSAQLVTTKEVKLDDTTLKTLREKYFPIPK